MRSEFDKNWFMSIRQHPKAKFDLVCFPCGGGAASSFWSWKTLSLNANIWALKLPGREARSHESPIHDATELIPQILEALPNCTKPFIFYGHSMGAGLAFLSILALQKNNRTLPKLFIAAGREPAHFSYPNPIENLESEDLINYLLNLGGIHQEIPRHEDFLRQYLLKIKSDYRLNSSIPKQDPNPLPLSIYVINGESDPLINLTRMQEWSEYTTEPIHIDILPGRHFFMEENKPLFKEKIQSALETWRLE